MNFTTCPNCKMRVLPKADGTCPSCQAKIPQEKHRNARKPEQQPKTRDVKAAGKHAALKVGDKNSAKNHYDHAYKDWENSEYEEALEKCDKAIELAPDWSEAHNLRGVILEDMDKPDQSILEYREAARLDPNNKDVKINLHYADKTKSAAQPKIAYEIAYGMVYFVGGLNFVLGSVTVLFNVEFLRQAGLGYISIIYGLVFLVLGFFVQRKSNIALILAITIFGLDSFLALLLTITQGNFLGIGILIPRIIFITPMIRGVGAIKALNQSLPARKRP